jgi:hypothetical protein
MNTTKHKVVAGVFLAFFISGTAVGLAQLIDTDRDGFPDEMEEAAGTDPSDAGAHPTLADNQQAIVAHWPLTEDANDDFPRGLHGVLRGKAKFESGALRLDGSDSYVDFGSSVQLSGSNGIAWSVWVKPANLGRSHVLGKYAAGGQEYACFILGGRIWAYVSDDGTSRAGHSLLCATREKVLMRGEWIHVAVSWQAGGLIEIFINGVRAPAWNTGRRLLEDLFNGSAPLTLGAYDVERKASNSKASGKRRVIRNAFAGEMAGLTLFSSSLMPGEATELWMIGRSGSLTEYIALDFDADGLPDWWERAFFGDTALDGSADSDGDGLTNVQEFTRGLDPTVRDKPDNPSADSDGDGITDADEVRLGMNPVSRCIIVPGEVLGLKLFTAVVR